MPIKQGSRRGFLFYFVYSTRPPLSSGAGCAFISLINLIRLIGFFAGHKTKIASSYMLIFFSF